MALLFDDIEMAWGSDVPYPSGAIKAVDIDAATWGGAQRRSIKLRIGSQCVKWPALQ